MADQKIIIKWLYFLVSVTPLVTWMPGLLNRPALELSLGCLDETGPCGERAGWGMPLSTEAAREQATAGGSRALLGWVENWQGLGYTRPLPGATRIHITTTEFAFPSQP